MAETPVPRSYPQILGAIIDGFLSKQGIPSMPAGDPLLSVFETSAQANFRSSQDIFGLLNSIGLAKATGLALIRIGAEEGLQKFTEAPATGSVTISDTSFVKIASKLYQGTPAPIIGSTTINLVDCSNWPSTGSLYIGRTTQNYEGALAYSGIVDNGTHWTVTLTSPTTRLHNVGESVILAQGGNRGVGAGTIVKTPQANINDSVEFHVLYGVTIPDGETEITGVSVVAELPGIIGRVPAGAITEFATPPFTGASVKNPVPFTNGRETETDDEFRERIKKTRRTRTKGTALAITSGVTGITATDENKSISSASIVTRTGYPTTLYIDDGTGYEERSSGVAVETLVDSALGGEQFFQATLRPIAKAALVAGNESPYLLANGDELVVRVGGMTYTHRFDAADFTAISSASAYEVVASINANSTLGFSARTANSGSQVVLFAKGDTNEELTVLSTSTDTFRFPIGTAYSIQLYKNDRLLQKDGRPAAYLSNLYSMWDAISGNQTLTLKVDGTPAQTFTFTDADFINGQTGYTQIGKNTLDAWVTVFNQKIPGVTARNDNGQIVLTSNLGPSARAAIEILDGSLVSVRMFNLGLVQGLNRDYTVDRNTSQIRLETPLSVGDRLTIGSSQTRSFLESLAIPATTTGTSSDLWFAVDGGAVRIPHGLSGSTPIDISVYGIHDWGRRLAISADGPAFANVREGDWMVGWDALLPDGLQNNLRVSEVERDSSGAIIGTYVTVERPGAKLARSGHRAVAVPPTAGEFSRVLVIGGYTRSIAPDVETVPEGATAACEYFDVNGGNINTLAPSMGTARAYATATTLNDGRVLVTGGVDNSGTYLATTEIFDPSSGTWTAGPALPAPRAHHTATKLLSGDVLIVGGVAIDDGNVTYSASACRFNAGSDTITNFGGTPLSEPRAQHRAALLDDGRVIIVGGHNDISGDLSSAEIYDASGPSTTAVSSMFVPRRDFGMVQIGGTVYVAGNHRTLVNRQTFETYDVLTDVWTIATISSSHDIEFESQDLGLNATGEPILFGGYYEDSTGKHPVVMSYSSGTWHQHDGNALNADTHTHWEKQWVQVYKNDMSAPDLWVGVGGMNATNFKPVAQFERFDANSGQFAWLDVDDDIAANLNLSSPPGLAFVRTEEPLQHLTLPSGTNYSAPSLVSFLNQNLVGAAASVYRTSRLRIATTSFGLDGDIALVAGDATALDTFKLSTGDAIENLVGHMASVESVNSEAGTPLFEETVVQGSAKESDPSFSDSLIVNTPHITGGHVLVGLRSQWDGLPTSFHRRFSSELNTRLKSGLVVPGLTAGGDSRFDARNASPSREHVAWERFFAGAPFSISHEDDLVVQIDADNNKRYSANMWRSLRPTTSVYGTSNLFKDADAGNASLAGTFGLGYDFNDFTVYMKARAVAFSGDSTRRVLFRYFRHGPDGEFAQVRFSNPDGPNASTLVDTDNADVLTSIRIKLPSGAARTPSIRSTTRLAYGTTGNTNGVGDLVFAVGFTVNSATRSSGHSVFTLQLPPGVTDSGLTATMAIYLSSTDVNFASGTYTISSVAAASGPGGTQAVTVVDTASGTPTSSNIGTVSLDSQGLATFAGASITAGDYLRIGSGTDVDPFYVGSTFRVTGTANQYLLCSSGEVFDEASNAGMDIRALNSAANLSIFASAPPTINSIVSTVNALAAADNSKCPITMVALGAGTGTIDRSTPEALLSQEWYTLADGVNWVSKTTSPVNTSGDYTLTFKQAITGSLASNSDWQNEDIRICPTTAKNLVDWLSAPAVSGLYATAIVQTAADGAKVQIASRTPGSAGSVHVQGGLANAVSVAVKGDTINLSGKGLSTVLRSAAAGLASRMWCSIDNNYQIPKSGIFTESTELVSWGTDGMVQTTTDVFTEYLNPINANLTFERQGKFVAIAATGLDQEKFTVVSAESASANSEYTVTVKIPGGLTGLGWQVGDDFFWQSESEMEVIAASRNSGTGNYVLTLRLPQGVPDSGYQIGDSFSLDSIDPDFASGTYTVTAVGSVTGGTQTVTFHDTAASTLSVSYSIGRVTHFNPNFSTDTFKITSIEPFDSGDGTQTFTFTSTVITDSAATNLGYITKKLDWGSLNEGDVVYISAPAVANNFWTDKQVPVQNQGLFRVVRVQSTSDIEGRGGTIWIENPNVVEGTFEARIGGYDYNSVLPGDLLVVNSDLWGAQNRGTWLVEKTGIEDVDSNEQFVDSTRFKVVLQDRTPVSVSNTGVLGASQVGLVQIIEGRPARLIKQIVGIAPNQDDGTYFDLRWDSSLHLQQISSTAGSVITALDKLAFPLDLASGVDGYSYSTGLIGEANRTVYGDSSDTATYPGIAAAGAQINISGPLVRRIKLALQLRVRTGASKEDVANRVRSAVAAVVNEIGIGEAVALSAIIAAASAVVGVISVTVISPVFNASNDLIAIQPFEKALITNLTQDISVTFTGE